MLLSYKKYRNKYLESCMKLIQSTWTFEEEFLKPKHPRHIYKYYVLNCVNWSEHLELLVDEDDQVQGLLFGSREDATFPQKMKFRLIQWKLRFSLWWHILLGDLGNRKRAVLAFRNMQRRDADGEAMADEFGSEVNLFILAPGLRGCGYGRELMDRYIVFCRKNDLKSTFLWTTTTCSWNFYERYGFKFLRHFPLPQATTGQYSQKEVGLIYYMDIS